MGSSFAAPAATLVVCALALLTRAPRASSQSPAEWSGAASFLISRPNDVRDWGVLVRREQQLRGPVISQYVASIDFIGDGLFKPMLMTVGANIGIRARGRSLAAAVTLGPTIAYFAAPHQADTHCAVSCVEIRRGYESGLRGAATAGLDIGYRLSPWLRLFYGVRGHVPFRLGHAGFTGDANAGFVESAIGLTFTRGAVRADWRGSDRVSGSIPQPLDVVGRPAAQDDSVPASIAEAESQAQRRMRIAVADPLPLQHVSFTIGSAERRCVDVGTATGGDIVNVGSGDFVVGGFSQYMALWHSGYGKLAWWPVHGSTAPPTGMTLFASRLDGLPVQRVYDVTLKHGQYYMYPADIRLPSTGRWLLIGTAGGNWGCFVFDLR